MEIFTSIETIVKQSWRRNNQFHRRKCGYLIDSWLDIGLYKTVVNWTCHFNNGVSLNMTFELA